MDGRDEKPVFLRSTAAASASFDVTDLHEFTLDIVEVLLLDIFAIY